MPETRKDLTQLRKMLVRHFNIAELRILCFDLGIDYEELEGGVKTTKVQDLILHLERRGKLQQLMDVAAEERPGVNWPDVSQEWEPENPRVKAEHLIDLPSTDKVLIIEDVKHQQMAIKQIVEDFRLRCEVASNLDEALEFIRSNRYALITLDMQLDFIDTEGQIGLMLLDQIQYYQNNVPVIIISGLGWTASDVRGFFVNYKTVDVFAKPFDPRELKKRMGNILDTNE